MKNWKSVFLFCCVVLPLFESCKQKDEIENIPVSIRIAPKIDGNIIVSDGEIKSDGRTLSGSDSLKTFFMIQIRPQNSSSISGTGGFEFIPEGGIPVDLTEGISYNLLIKAIRKGTAYGPVFSGTNLSVSPNYPINNEIDYINPITSQFDRSVGSIYTNPDSTITEGGKEPTEMDVYFGSTAVTGFTEGDTFEIDLRREVFGIEIFQNGLETGQFIQVVLYPDPAVFTQTTELKFPDDSIYRLFAMIINGQESRKIPVKIFLNDNGTESILYNQDVTFNRLKIKRFEVNLSNNSGDKNSKSFVNLVDYAITRGDTISVN